jgi:RNA polymerase sigma factor (sigma-70 family)
MKRKNQAPGSPPADVAPKLLNQHPLRARRRPGPPGQDVVPRADQDLDDAHRVLELIDGGVLPRSGPLAERIQTWGDVDARNALVLANLGLVHLVANQMRRNGIRYEDLVQEGTLGLLRATETFEPHRNVRFSTYCVYWIRAKIQRYLQRLDRDDTPSIAGAEMETLVSGRRRRPRARSVSIDTPIDEEADRSVGDVLKDHGEKPDEASLRFERARAVSEVLDGICAEIGDPRLRTIIEKRLLADEPETLAVLGDRLNLSREGARLLENKVLKLARQRLYEFRETA